MAKVFRSESGHLSTRSACLLLWKPRDRARAARILEDLKTRSSNEFVSSYTLALAYAGAGEKDQTFASLEQAIQERMPLMVFLKVDPIWDYARSDTRFADLVRQVGLQQQ
jgi:hypothetical protein